MPRFVILKHEMPADSDLPSHFDLMLESPGALLTWRLPTAPCPGLRCEAIQLAEHRLAYLEYEGPLTENRGHVSRTESGIFQQEERADADLDHLSINYWGHRMSGQLILRRIETTKWEAHFTERAGD